MLIIRTKDGEIRRTDVSASLKLAISAATGGLRMFD
jgi:hypothetical protein